MGILEPIIAFHKSRDRRFEITELSYRSCQQSYTYTNIKRYMHTYIA